mmetsp:Transcript_5438/g.11739  ORF Transcript_5438/g.11739 Transcript_5438/m.11739 type:complete len:219 (-) Transcript_5438:796-1452(-)
MKRQLAVLPLLRHQAVNGVLLLVDDVLLLLLLRLPRGVHGGQSHTVGVLLPQLALHCLYPSLQLVCVWLEPCGVSHVRRTRHERRDRCLGRVMQPQVDRGGRQDSSQRGRPHALLLQLHPLAQHANAVRQRIAKRAAAGCDCRSGLLMAQRIDSGAERELSALVDLLDQRVGGGCQHLPAEDGPIDCLGLHRGQQVLGGGGERGMERSTHLGQAPRLD